jgi:hypothetical protein
MRDAHYLNAVVERGKSLQLITEEYSRDAIVHLLKRGPDAIALAPAGVLDATRLLAEFKRLAPIGTDPTHTTHSLHWRCYWQPGTGHSLRFCGVLEDEHKVTQQIETLVRSFFDAIIVLVSSDVIAPTNLHRHLALNFDDLLESVISESIVPSPNVVTATSSSSDREQLRELRRELLGRFPSFVSEDLAAGGDSTSDNPSQYALDLRNSAKVFGVRFGRVWHYPKFQFDSNKRPHPEMKQVLASLAPDPKGWDRLQWFVTPHEHLRGKTPLQVWSSDRQKVIEAASTERWHGRRD